MFDKKIETIFTQSSLLDTLKNYQKARDYDSVLSLINSGAFLKTIHQGFVPDPVVSFEIEKDKNKKRQLAISSTASKVVQKI